jgi:23S rRNA G2445 N2-methylase RlmL
MNERKIRIFNAEKKLYAAGLPKVFINEALEELERLGAENTVKRNGKIYFNADARSALKIAFSAALPTSIDLVIKTFRAGALEELYKKTLAVEWELFLPVFGNIETEAHLFHSRIEHEGNAADTVIAAVRKRLQDAGLPSGNHAYRQKITAVIEDNQCELRVSYAGEQLFKRGYRKEQGSAPIRENTAAALIAKYLKIKKAAPAAVFDPMCGSGTLLFETFSALNSVSLAAERDFNFTHWRNFEEKTWGYLLKKNAEQLKASTDNNQVFYLANDISMQAVNTAKKNAAAAGLDKVLRFYNRDFFDFKFDNNRLEEIKIKLIIVNPPYGARLPGGEALYAKLMKIKKEQYSSWDWLVIVPAEFEHLMDKGFCIDFLNGGLEVKAYYYTV